MSGSSFSLQGGFDLGRSVQVVGRAGALAWNERYQSRFDIPGQPAIRAETSTSGTGAILGAGIAYRFAAGCQLEARYDYAKLDDDTITLLTLGLSFDLIGLVRE
jgi:hypothetical protein